MSKPPKSLTHVEALTPDHCPFPSSLPQVLGLWKAGTKVGPGCSNVAIWIRLSRGSTTATAAEKVSRRSTCAYLVWLEQSLGLRRDAIDELRSPYVGSLQDTQSYVA